LRPWSQVAEAAGLPVDALVPYGRTKAKVDHALASADPAPGARLALVTGITPTPAGEGKTVTAVGLAMALTRLGRRAIATLRQPSMGPVFGVKGGGAGGGKSVVEPLEELNLHLTGDFHAVAAANNLLAAAVDTSILLDNPLAIDPEKVTWRRVLDVNDRALRQIRVGLGGPKNGIARDTGFDITAASEVMSCLGLARDRRDLRARLDGIVVGQDFHGQLVTAGALEVAGAMAALLRDALDPTLVQTSEGTPVLVHTGPFANISYGNSSVIADRIAARHGEWVVTEAGFGADMGAEKFFNIKCRNSGIRPDVAVVVASVRALKSHSGKYPLSPGAPLPPELLVEDLAALEQGCANLDAHLGIVGLHGVPAVVAINRFPSDTQAELDLVRRRALAGGAAGCAISDVWAKGGEGGRELAEVVIAAAAGARAPFRPLYDLELSIQEKLRALATRVYAAGSVQLSPRATEDILRFEQHGYGRLPVCVAKTQYSLSHDAQFKGRPSGFVFPVREVRLYAGAGFLVALAGDIMTMPGLGRSPAYRRIDLDAQGRVQGLT
jgi:formate--tetrahydrofolate ligase